ncbi:hypothetical protein CO083_04010 [Candidatus Roizmanbacteria bacterium CG_4_9_14_0_8_um_filter_34_12]|uniref:PDZ domain-containing protein n=4 Tax=Candidatus Roizmaniibacteriota TaxID=1752723 RepID=A0A2H0C5W2_9BACT|nr:MAG: hypothetical protein COW96_00575 [Candidatus Roizmanbacteria bacterium CG22_combo_CG10-13_8_21_14_all_33_16]PIX73828.1 MAG: hypothetical protein COZ39_01600 [Candidatus Roizmanbacteria bacterium CG_4_10_14_3_um_filter_33_21]PJB88011.1 MAG: hypothetical protein CO083_04010 [Candidatus Roizmanbacteria bacterium CG_4_9_14_0_8_um_filter_34_12]
MKKTTSQHHKHKETHHSEVNHPRRYHNADKQKVAIKKSKIFILICLFVFLLILPLIINRKLLNNKNAEVLLDQKQYYYGVGVGITFDNGKAVVTRVIVGTPAEKAGILLNDIITKVDSIPVSIENSRDLCREIRGQEGSVVNLSILRQNKMFDKKLERTKIYSRTPTMCQ